MSAFCCSRISRIGSDNRFSQSVTHNGVVYCVGKTCKTEKGVGAQTAGALRAIDEMLADAGTSKSKLLSATIWLSSMSDYAKMNEEWVKWLDPENVPVRACIEAGLVKDALVEIKVTAAL